MLSFTPFRFAKACHIDKDYVLRHLNDCPIDSETFFSHQVMSIEMSGQSSLPMFEREYRFPLSTTILSSFKTVNEADRASSGR